MPGSVQVESRGGILARQILQQRLSLEPGYDWVDVFTNQPPTGPLNLWTIPYGTNASSLFRIRAVLP